MRNSNSIDTSTVVMPAFAEHLQNMIDHAAVGAAMFDAEMRYLAWSKRWSIDCRLGTRDLPGLSQCEVSPNLSEEWTALHRRTLAGATERNEADVFPRADGQEDFLRWSIQPWYNDDNQRKDGALHLEDTPNVERAGPRDEFRDLPAAAFRCDGVQGEDDGCSNSLGE